MCDDVSGGAVMKSIDMNDNLWGIVPIEVSLLVSIDELNSMISFTVVVLLFRNHQR